MNSSVELLSWRVVAAWGASLILSFVGVGLALLWSRRAKLLDVPDERSSHVVATPSGGGIGIAAAVILVLALAAWLAETPEIAWFMGAVGFSSWVGFCDDRRPLSIRVRLVALGLASVPIMLVSYADLIHLPYLSPFSLGYLAVPLTLLWLMGFANTFNFMDGINGISGLTAGVSGLGFALAGILAGDSATALLGAITAGAALGFLPWNFPRAKIFMGDAGSLPMGLLLAGTALVAARERGSGVDVTLPFPASVQILGPFLFDVILTLARRALHGKKIGAPHKEHLYQRLSRQWGGHAWVTALYGLFSVSTVGLALFYSQLGDLSKLLSLTLSVAAMSIFAQVVLSRDDDSPLRA